MRDWIETISLFALVLITVGLMGYGVCWLYDCFCGDWLDKPMVEAAEERPRPDTYQVMPGDTIWSIYVTYYKGCDWDEVRYKIGRANGLRNDTLYPYETIKLPEVSR